MKLAGGSPSLAADLNVDAFLQQARSYDEAASSSPLSWYLRYPSYSSNRSLERLKKRKKKREKTHKQMKGENEV